MLYKSLYVRGTDDVQWEKIFSYVLNRAGSFKCYFSNGNEASMNIGIAAFKEIPGINIKYRDDMVNNIEISGGLNEETKKVFTDFISKTSGVSSVLPSFRLYDGERELLYVGNHADKIIHLIDEEIEFIENLGVEASKWDLIKLNSEEDEVPDIVNLFNIQMNNDNNI